MNLSKKGLLTLEEFFELRTSTEKILEYIDGAVFMSPSPSTRHQRISSRLHAQLFNHLKNSKCEVFPAPYDIELQCKQMTGTKIVVPDLSVICEKSGIKENKFVGVPELIIEIISPSNQAHDLVLKLNLYMQYGVKEYWIVNPLLSTVQLYTLNDFGQYQQADVLKEKGIARSVILEGFAVDITELFL